jgi:RNA polymerase sigma factor (sigma-70 family)
MLDSDLIKNIKQNIFADDSINELLNRHAGLINQISSKYNHLIPEPQEFLKEKHYIIYKAALSYKENKNTKFSSYLGSFTRWYCLNKINKHKLPPLNDDVVLENLPENKEDIAEISERAAFLLNQIKDKRIKKIFEMRYFHNSKTLSWEKISEHFGISGQTCNNLHRKGLKIINKFLKTHKDE